MNLPAYQEWRRLYLARKGVADYGAAPEKGIPRGQYSELMRLLQRSDGVRPIPRGNPAQNRALRDDIRVIFGALKGRAHVAMTIRDGSGFSSAKKTRVQPLGPAPKTTPKPSACRGTSTGPRVARFASQVLW